MTAERLTTSQCMAFFWHRANRAPRYDHHAKASWYGDVNAFADAVILEILHMTSQYECLINGLQYLLNLRVKLGRQFTGGQIRLVN